VIARARAEGRQVLSEAEAAAVLAGWGVPQPHEALVDTRAEAVLAARRIGLPVVLKLCSLDVIHKSDVGGVRLGLGDETAIAAAFDELAALAAGRGARFGGVLVQAQVPADVEIIVGARHDPVFGPVVLVGLGGVLAELLDDSAVRLAPVGADEARAMIRQLRGYRLLAGYRGRPAIDLAALAELVQAVSRAAVELPVAELDLNPVLARAGAPGVTAVDRRLVLRRADAGGAARAETPAEVDGTRQALRRLLAPRSVAVVGASRDPSKIGGRVLQFLTRHGFEGRVFAVTPNAAAIDQVPAVATVAALPEPVDLACIVVPPDGCAPALRACGERGIPSAIVFTSGFAEAGAEEAERELTRAARASGIRFCGPNSLGVLNPEARLCASFSAALHMPPLAGGEIAYVSQSGALGGSYLSRLWEKGIAVSRFVSVGNQADLDIADYVDVLVDDPGARVIALFIEGVRDGRKLGRALARARDAGKPVVVYKAGRSREGQAAIRSHTGVLAGDDAVWTAALRQAGALRVADMAALFDSAVALAWLPPPPGRRVGIVSTSGGACGILADECRRHGFEVPELPPGTRRKVEAEIPPFGASGNPIDVTAQMLARPAMLKNTLSILLEEPGIDAVLVMITTLADPVAETVAGDILAAAAGCPKPILVGWIIAPSLAPKGMARLHQGRLPFYDSPERVVQALAALADWQALRARAG
jgi:acyl-CoA synthetase (NDP forming)